MMMAATSKEALPGQMAYTTVGNYYFTVPAGVTSLSMVCIGGGGGTGYGGGSLSYLNNFPVTPGWIMALQVGNAGSPGQSGFASFVSPPNLSAVCYARGGGTGDANIGTASFIGGTVIGDSGGAGGGWIGQDGQSTYDGKEAWRGQAGTSTAAGGVINNSSDQQGALLGGRSTAGSGYGGAGGGGYWGGSAGGYSESNTMSGGGGGSGYFNSTYINDGKLYTGDRTTPGQDDHPLRSTYGQGGLISTNGIQGVLIVRYPI